MNPSFLHSIVHSHTNSFPLKPNNQQQQKLEREKRNKQKLKQKLVSVRIRKIIVTGTHLFQICLPYLNIVNLTSYIQ